MYIFVIFNLGKIKIIITLIVNCWELNDKFYIILPHEIDIIFMFPQIGHNSINYINL